MKTLCKLAVLAVAATVALGLAANALAVQKLSVSQTPTSLTIKISQAQTDPQPARISIYVPTGYSLNTSQGPGTVIGTTSGSVFARDANIPLPLSGDVVVAPPNTNAAPCFTGTHQAVWLLRLQVAGQQIQLPIAVDQTTGSNAAFGAYQLVTCLAPADVPQGTPGRSPNGGPGTLTITSRVTNKKKRTLRLSGRLAQGGAAVVGAQVRLLLNGKSSRFTARSSPTGAYSIVLRKTGKRSVTTFQARVTVAERDITSTGCATPTLPVVPCVSATASPFTAVSRRLRIRL